MNLLVLVLLVSWKIFNSVFPLPLTVFLLFGGGEKHSNVYPLVQLLYLSSTIARCSESLSNVNDYTYSKRNFLGPNLVIRSHVDSILQTA